ncbi:MAG: hypothetical protein R3C20_10530 [Planctomycetaceae bacterium]
MTVPQTNSTSAKAMQLLRQVQGRLKAAAFGRAFFMSSLVAISVAATAVILVRLAGLLPPSEQRMQWLFAVPAMAFLLSAVFHRRVEQAQAARRIDEHARTNDLFLTLSTLQSSAGEYQPLVAQAAETSAERIRAAEVVPFRFEKQFGTILSASAALALMVWLLPQLDPFGKVEAAVKVEEQKKQVETIRKAARTRQEQLLKELLAGKERSEEIDKNIEGLKNALRAMKPKDQKSNSKVLQSNRSEFNEQWKMVSSEGLRKMLSEQALSQQFGGERAQKMNDWLKELQQGKTDSLQKELEKAQDTMEAMMEAKTPEQKKELAQKLRRQLQDLKKFSSEKASSSELANALDKALKSLEAAANQEKKGDGESSDEMSKEAMEALKESLNLSKQELQELARSAEDMKKLEEALKTLQQAEKLNQNGQLDGEECEGCNSLSEYAEMYKKMMAEMGEPGEGMGNRGFGKGGEAPEDDSDPEGYKDEKSKTQIQAGKVLLSIKTKEYASEKDFDPNELRQYKESVSNIKSGVQAAIESEQVPPGYVDGIKGYFDKLDSPASKAE